MDLISASLIALLPLLAAPPPLSLRPAGRVLEVEGSCRGSTAFERRVSPPGPGYLLLELEGASLGELPNPARSDWPDLDLRATPARGKPSLGASHRSHEHVLVALPKGERVDLAVFLASGKRERFTLRVTFFDGVRALEPAAPLTLELPAGQARLLEVPPAGGPPGARRRSPAQRIEARALGSGSHVDLLAFDRATDLIGVGLCHDEREAVYFDRDLGGGDRGEQARAAGWVAVVARQGPVRARVQAVACARQPVDAFLAELGGQRADQQSADRRAALAALRRHPDFVALRFFLESSPRGRSLELRSHPGLEVRGVERFGTYSQRKLTINPTKREHRQNVQELVDTLVHELIHAILALRGQPRGGAFDPLAGDVTDAAHDERLGEHDLSRLKRGALGPELESYLERYYGRSASNPEEDYTDINAGAQRLIVKVIEANLARTRLGQETLVFLNVRARADRDRLPAQKR